MFAGIRFFFVLLHCFFFFCAGSSMAMAQFVPSVTREITENDLKPLFTQVIEENAPWEMDEMEITDIRAYPSRLKVPAGEIEYDVDLPSNGRYLGKVSALVTVNVDGVPTRRVRVTGHVEVYRNVACARHAMKRGDRFDLGTGIEIVRRPLSRLRGAVVQEPDMLAGYAASRSIRPGQVITENMLEAPVIVKRGKRVMIVARSPFINIRTPGVVMQNGSAGDLVKVRNVMSKRDITAMVVDGKTVQVLF